MKVNGWNILHFPYASVAAFRDKPRMCGIPLLAPWADRLDEAAFYANDRKYSFNRSLGNVHFDEAGHPIHGFLTLTPDWEVTGLVANAGSVPGSVPPCAAICDGGVHHATHASLLRFGGSAQLR